MPSHTDDDAAALYGLLLDPEPLLTAPEVGCWLGVSPKTLESWRSAGGGPRYVRLSRKAVRYRRDDVKAFIEARLKAHTAAA